MVHRLHNDIVSYLVACYSLQDLETRLLSTLQEILNSGDMIAIQIANNIDADFVELGEGLIDEATFRGRLENYLAILETVNVVFKQTEHPATVDATVNVETVANRWEIPGPVLDLHLVHEFA